MPPSRPRRAASERARALGCGTTKDQQYYHHGSQTNGYGNTGLSFEMVEQALNPAFYVGYVEDDESEEAIMKKFEALESFQKAKAVAQQNTSSSLNALLPPVITTTTTTSTSTSDNIVHINTNPDSILNIELDSTAAVVAATENIINTIQPSSSSSDIVMSTNDSTLDPTTTTTISTTEQQQQQQELSENDLQQVFRLTSAFTVASTVVGDMYTLPQDLLMEVQNAGENWREWDLVDDDEEQNYYFSMLEDDFDNSDNDEGDDEGEWGSRRRHRGRGGRRSSNSKRNNKHGKKLSNTKPVEYDENGLPKPRTTSSNSSNTGRKRSNSTSNKDLTDIDPLSARNAARLSMSSRKVRKITDPNAISYVKIPNNPIPSSWAKRIIQWVPPQAIHAHTNWIRDDVLMTTPVKWSITSSPGSKYVETNLVHDWKTTSTLLLNLAKERGGFSGIVLNPPWREPWPGAPISFDGTIEPEDLSHLPLANNEFLDAGFVYIWSPKHLLHRVLITLEKMNFHYVENAIVVHETAGGDAFVSKPCTYFSQSKDVLLLCRRGQKNMTTGKIEWKRIELRHQRISDVYQACHTFVTDGEVEGDHLRENKPWAYVHKMCETMLPEARYDVNNPNTPCKLIELWGKHGMTRSGWVSVAQQPPPPAVAAPAAAPAVVVQEEVVVVVQPALITGE
jgi:hypothetical protein